MADEGEEADDPMLVGITLVSDVTGQSGTAVGCLILKQTSKWEPLSTLRSQISTQVANLTSDYMFLTSQKWPVKKCQENQLKLHHVLTPEGAVCIRKEYQKPKIGIKAKTGMPLGFVFVDYNTRLADLREIINQELSFFYGIPDTYVFVDANGWPVGRRLESDWSVLDVLSDGCVVVCADVLSLENQNGISLSVDMQPPCKKVKGLRALSYRTTKDSDRQFSVDVTEIADTSTTSKQLLISYVRAEAADHALKLKEELSSLGFSVYLDVHEIKSGVDWQDSLNDAVSNCEVFVPLVTPRYGETQWTNREVKLADVLGKYILPINFLDTWPPRCLAIQFATTQYIGWKTPAQIQTEIAEGKGAGATDIEIWDLCYIKKVAKDIGERLRQLKQEHMNRVPSLSRRKTLMKTFAGKLPEGIISVDESLDEGKALVVICVHPAQAKFGEEIRQLLENEGLSVWCTSSIDRETVELEFDTLPLSQENSDDQDFGNSSQVSFLSPTPSNQTFQEFADRASVVIVIVSKAFSRSRTCQQQVFYCEHRKRVIPLKYEDFCIPGWMSMLIGTNTFENMHQKNYQHSLVTRVKRCIDPTGRDNLVEEFSEVKLTRAVNHIKSRVGQSSCVYISGGTKFYNQNTEAICRSIGSELAQLASVSVATGGFYGIGETVSRTFYEESQRLWRKKDVWHVLPEKDDLDRSEQANQNPDHTFNIVSFGKTVFCGDSVRERESIVARAFEICVLIEGGPGAAHEAEQFVWNDRIVIPIRSTGGAAGGKFSVPDKIFEVPQGVSEYDWNILDQSDASPKEIGQSVSRIIQTLLKKMSSEDLASFHDTPTKEGNRSHTPSPSKSPSPVRPGALLDKGSGFPPSLVMAVASINTTKSKKLKLGTHNHTLEDTNVCIQLSSPTSNMTATVAILRLPFVV